MKTPYHTLEIKYSIEHDRKCNKIKCTVTVDPEWPIFAHWGKTILHKRTYTNSRTFRCKPEQLESLLEYILYKARRRLKKLKKTEAKSQDLINATRDIHISTIW